MLDYYFQDLIPRMIAVLENLPKIFSNEPRLYVPWLAFVVPVFLMAVVRFNARKSREGVAASPVSLGGTLLYVALTWGLSLYFLVTYILRGYFQYISKHIVWLDFVFGVVALLLILSCIGKLLRVAFYSYGGPAAVKNWLSKLIFLPLLNIAHYIGTLLYQQGLDILFEQREQTMASLDVYLVKAIPWLAILLAYAVFWRMYFFLSGYSGEVLRGYTGQPRPEEDQDDIDDDELDQESKTAHTSGRTTILADAQATPAKKSRQSKQAGSGQKEADQSGQTAMSGVSGGGSAMLSAPPPILRPRQSGVIQGGPKR